MQNVQSYLLQDCSILKQHEVVYVSDIAWLEFSRLGSFMQIANDTKIIAVWKTIMHDEIMLYAEGARASLGC